MLSINTNLSSLIVQGNLKQSTNSLNTAIERMTTGCKLNHASDNAANYSIKTNMDTKIGAYMVAEDNTAMGIDLLTTAESSLSLIGDKLARLRTLAVQSSNGTYGTESQKAINSEANALIDEMQRLHSTTEYNGKKLLGASENSGNSASVKMSPVKFTRRDTTNMKKLGEIENASVALADGTYSISTAEELAQLATMTNAGLISEGDEFVLANDIDLSAYATGEGWTPIGTKDNKFAGTFDGNGHTITNLYINRPAVGYQGLFGDSQGILRNINITNANVIGDMCVGIITGVQRGNSIYNCHVLGVLNISSRTAGGIAGQFFGEMRNCSSDVDIAGAVNDVKQIGGLIGLVSGGSAKIDSCYTNSRINGANYLGGFIGACNSNVLLLEIFNSYAITNVTIKNASRYTSAVGGFIGCSNANINIENCYSSGKIYGDAISTCQDYIGGFIGAHIETAGNLNVNNCYSNVDINIASATNEIYGVGGFCGSALGLSSDFRNCYALGNITASNAPLIANIGGFVGGQTSSSAGGLYIENCYSNVDINIANASDIITQIGGFCGYLSKQESVIKNCYTVGDISIGSSPNTKNIGGFVGLISNQKDNSLQVIIENCYNNNKIEVSDISTLSSCASFIGYVNNSGAVTVKNSSTLMDKDSDILSLWCAKVMGADFSIENSYYNKEFANSGLNLFSDENGNVINDTNLVSQVKTCVTDDPFQLYINQQTNLQVGISSGSSSNVIVDTTCSLKYMNILRNIGLQEDDYLSKIDELMNDISLKQTQYGAANNRLLSAMEEINVQYENLVSSRSTIQDADMGEVSATYIQQQILQQASATLMATANQTPAIALQLL